MDCWAHEWTDAWTDGCFMDGRLDWLNGWEDVWMYGQMNRHVDGETDEHRDEVMNG